jgi:hypothetical protein
LWVKVMNLVYCVCENNDFRVFLLRELAENVVFFGTFAYMEEKPFVKEMVKMSV